MAMTWQAPAAKAIKFTSYSQQARTHLPPNSLATVHCSRQHIYHATPFSRGDPSPARHPRTWRRCSSPPSCSSSADDEVSDVGKAGLFTLLDCGSGPPDVGDSAAAAPSSKNNASAGDLSELLAAIPSVAAPEGFGHLSRGGAPVRGVCVSESSPESCRTCLIDAAWSLTKGCGIALRRAGAWSNHCIVAYDCHDGAAAGGGVVNPTSAAAFTSSKLRCFATVTSPGCTWTAAQTTAAQTTTTTTTTRCFPEQTLSPLATDLARRAAGDRSRMTAAGEASDRPGETVRAVAQCARDRTEPECLRCLQASARQAAASCDGDSSGWVQGGHGLTYGCYLRFAISSVPASAAVLRWASGGVLAVAALHLLIRVPV